MIDNTKETARDADVFEEILTDPVRNETRQLWLSGLCRGLDFFVAPNHHGDRRSLQRNPGS